MVSVPAGQREGGGGCFTWRNMDTSGADWGGAEGSIVAQDLPGHGECAGRPATHEGGEGCQRWLLVGSLSVDWAALLWQEPPWARCKLWGYQYSCVCCKGANIITPTAYFLVAVIMGYASPLMTTGTVCVRWSRGVTAIVPFTGAT
jgi:hypothetical protein